MYLCFSDLWGDYLYDSKKNEIRTISPALSDCLAKKSKIPEELRMEYEKLLQEGFLDETPHPLEYPVFEQEEALFTRSLSNGVIQITQNCNFRCDYCAFTANDGSTRKHNAKKMNWETMKKAIDFIHRSSIDSRQVSIGFYGGEPLLEFALLKQAITYANHRFSGKALLYSITTNASLLTEEILEFLNDNTVSLTISLDGPQEINDAYRKTANSKQSAYQYAKQAIQTIVARYPNLARLLGVNMVLVPTHPFEDYLSIFSDIPELRQCHVRGSVVSEDGLLQTYEVAESFQTGYEYSMFLNRLNHFDSHLIPQLQEQGKLTEALLFQKMEMAKNFVHTRTRNVAPAGPCIPIHHKIFIDVDGNLLPCEKVSENCSALKVGDIERGVDIEKAKKTVQLANLTPQSCRSCWAYNLCTVCVRTCIHEDQLSSQARQESCRSAKQEAKEILYECVSFQRDEALSAMHQGRASK